MSTFPNDAVSIVDGNTYSMLYRRPDKGFSVKKKYNNRIFVAQSGHEKRTNISGRSKRSISLTFNKISGGYKTALENFFDNQVGELKAFYFDLSYIGLVGTILVRFEGELSISEVQTGDSVSNSIYDVSIALTETYN